MDWHICNEWLCAFGIGLRGLGKFIFVDNVFFLLFQVKCLQCSYCSNTFDPFLDLSLEIVKADSLHKALVNFTAAEQLDGGERQYQCHQCKQKVRALKQLTVHKAPYVLTIHLKRFHSHDPGQKIKRKVHFGTTLDLTPFVSGSYVSELVFIICFFFPRSHKHSQSLNINDQKRKIQRPVF